MRLVFTFVFLLLSLQNAFADTISGNATVLDGGMLEIDGQQIRLHGINAPDTNQTCQTANGGTWKCGEKAKQYLRSLVQGETVHCIGTMKDRFERIIARCSSSQGDINFLMVRSGLSLAYRSFTHDYDAAENQAKYEKRGIWQGKAEPSWQFRDR